MLSQFQAVGCALLAQKLVSSYSGNLSIRQGDRILITHRGSGLGSIKEADLVETGIVRNNRDLSRAALFYEKPPCLQLYLCCL